MITCTCMQHRTVADDVNEAHLNDIDEGSTTTIVLNTKRLTKATLPMRCALQHADTFDQTLNTPDNGKR